MKEARSLPLLYRAAKSGVFGNVLKYDSGCFLDAMFVFVEGVPSPEGIAALKARFTMRPLVAMTSEWEEYIRSNFPEAHTLKRWMMKPADRFDIAGKAAVPEGFEASAFDELAFDAKPFSHGENYLSFEDFSRRGAGGVVRHGEKIAASASSFLSFENEVELDVSTEEAYRGRGLATACVSVMLAQCMEKGLTVHWDAQNEISRRLAEKFGFEVEACYTVYVLPVRAKA